MIIKVSNPYWDKEYEVTTSKKYIENTINNIVRGYENFIVLHTVEGTILTIAPKNFASVEIVDEKND